MSNLAFEQLATDSIPAFPRRLKTTYPQRKKARKALIAAKDPSIQRMKQRRNQLGYKSSDIAKAVGMNYTTYTNYENGVREPSPLALECIAEILHCNPAWLAGYSDQMEIEAVPPKVGPEGCDVQFSDTFLNKHGLSLDAIMEIEVLDDVMEPVLTRGDMVIVDKANTDVKSRQLFLIELWGNQSVRWLTPNFGPEGGFVISTSKDANRGDEIRVPQSEAENYKVLGRVVGDYKTIF